MPSAPGGWLQQTHPRSHREGEKRNRNANQGFPDTADIEPIADGNQRTLTADEIPRCDPWDLSKLW